MAGTNSLGRLTLDLVLKAGAFTAGMTAAERQANKSLTAIEKRAYKFGQTLGAGIRSGAVIATAALAALGVAVGKSIDNADAMRDLSIRIGVGTEKLSEYAYAAKQTGTDIDGLARGLKILSKNAAEAADETSAKGKLFEALGIDVIDPITKSLKSLDQLLPEIANKFKNLEDGTTKAALAQELFGKSGLELIEFLNQGGQGLDEMGEKARRLGIVISEDTAAAADEFNDRLADLRAQGAGFANEVTAQLLPALNQTVSELSSLIKQGDFASNTVTLLTGAINLGVGAIQVYNRAVQAASSLMYGYAESIAGVWEMQKNIATLGFADGTVAGGIGRTTDALKGMNAERDKMIAGIERERAISANNANLPSNFSSGSSRRGGPTKEEIEATKAATAAVKDREATEKRLNAMFASGGGGGKKGGGKSDAEKEAEQLKKAYDQMIANQERTIALFGEEGEAAQIAYDIKSGVLSKYSEAEQQQLLTNAKRIDQQKEMDELEKAAAKASEDEFKSMKEGRDQTDLMLQDMEFEISLIGKSNEARERAIFLRGLDKDATDEQREAAAAFFDEIKKGQEMDGFMQDFKEGFEDAFVDFASGAKSAKEAFADFADSIFKRALQFLADKAINAMFDAFSRAGGTGAGAGSGGGFNWGALVGAFFGGGKASGGAVNAGMFYRVNENGPEMLSVSGKDYLMMGSNSGVVTPNRGGVGGATQNNQFIFAAPTNPKTQTQVAARTGFELRRAQRLGT